MGSSILSGLLDATRSTTDSNGSTSAKISRFIVSTKSAASAHRLCDEFKADESRVDMRHSANLLAMQEANIVLLACKPYLAEEVLGEPGVREALAGKLVISIMAGKTPEHIEKYIYRDSPSGEAESKAIIVRAMPNVAARLRQSMTIIEINNSLSYDMADTLAWIFEQIGKVKFLATDLFDIGTMLVGSSIAVLTVPLDGILDGCVAEGIRRADALEMAAQNLIGMAGTNEAEVRKTVQDMKSLGFKGVILGYARESIAKADENDNSSFHVEESQLAIQDQAVEEWRQGNLRTLKMIGAGDFLGIKFTGAGPKAVEALSRGDLVPPPSIAQAIEEICEATASQNSRLWIDAEQQVFQPTIDAWTIDLMRRFNRNGRIVVYNTIQAYLKSSTENVHRHLCLAQREGWTLGIKLVRGAYIAHDIRSRIHDTKADTDNSYDYIVESLLSREFPLKTASDDASEFPDVRLFVASHNADSVRKASTLYRQRIHNGQPTIPLEIGQLQGMADEVSCELLAGNSTGQSETPTPGVFKCLAWGTTEECLHFLLRRAIENKSAMERTRDTAVAMRREARRRVGW
ncbi:pyrroline-5-carboxylate reductase [Aspergillus lentulus]|uniref:Proline dehydrogenase n=1 Tax=Aspergillus lentulus TaxID=293939 RepID=A0AAN4PF78_ASPLE|nr:pyrroline-5-carboxylate reductase [Aspergillus lentulus]